MYNRSEYQIVMLGINNEYKYYVLILYLGIPNLPNLNMFVLRLSYDAVFNFIKIVYCYYIMNERLIYSVFHMC